MVPSLCLKLFTKTPAGVEVSAAKKMLECEIESVDGQIDRLVYELYGLTEEEIRIVEGAVDG